MGLFGIGKKKKAKDLGLGSLPDLPKLPDMPKPRSDLPQLPGNLPKNTGFSFPGKMPEFKKESNRPLPSIDIPDIKVKPKIVEKIPISMDKKGPIEIGSNKPIEIEPEKPKQMFKNIIKKPFLSRAKQFEDNAIKIEEHELQEIHEHLSEEPVFVEGNIFKQVLSDIVIINNDLKESFDSLDKVISLEKRKGAKFNNFKLGILSVQRKLIFVDRLLFK